MPFAIRLTVLLSLLHSTAGCQQDNTIICRFGDGDQYRVDIAFLTEVRLAVEDIAPQWDLGRMKVQTGAHRVIVISRATLYADSDENGEPVEGTMRERKIERVWLTIPAGTAMNDGLRVDSLERSGLVACEVNNLDGRGYLKAPYVPKGFVKVLAAREDELDVLLDIQVRPTRPFLAENWLVEGTRTVARGIAVEVERFGGLLKEIEIRRTPPS